MAIRDIVFFPDPVLQKKCPPVEEVDDSIRQLVDDMAETMYAAPGIGLAAPQVGVSKRITVIDIRRGEDEEDDGEEAEEGELLVFINPEIIEREGTISWEEGCLSIPGIYEKVKRSERVVVRALDRNGEPFEMEADELLAVALQHEIDHLDGGRFPEHLSHLKRRLAVKKYKKLMAKAAEDDDEEDEEGAR